MQSCHAPDRLHREPNLVAQSQTALSVSYGAAVPSHKCDMIIVGAGPTGLYAAYYAGFRGFTVTLIDALPELGGQVTAMYPEKEIFDIAGFPQVKGRELVHGLAEQALQFDPKLILGEQATSLTTDADFITVGTDQGSAVTGKAVVLTSGIGSFKPRPIPIGEEWVGRGVVYFVPSLAAHAGKDVVIIGGGDSAFDWAWSLQTIAKSVTLVHRRDQFRAHATTVDKVRKMGVRLITSAEISDARGDDWISEIDVTSRLDGSVETLRTDSVVASLGFIANIGPLADWGIDLDKRRVVVDSAMQTSRDGIYAAGDITTYLGKVPLISVGFGEAATAVNNAAPRIDPTHGVFPGHSSGESAG